MSWSPSAICHHRHLARVSFFSRFPKGGCEGLLVLKAEMSLKLDPITHIVVSVRVRLQKPAN